VLRYLAGTGIGTAAFGRAIVALAQDASAVTPEMIDRAEWIAGIDLTPEERELMTAGVNDLLEDFARNREVALDNAVAPAVRFDPEPGSPSGDPARAVHRHRAARPVPEARRPASDDDVAFASIAVLGALLRTRGISATELTELALARLERFDPVLRCVVSVTADLARTQAEAAQRRIDAREAGDLVGIPWGAKDLLAVPGYPTTWGAKPYRDQVIDVEATAARRLREAGAPLVAKLTLGALAWGDVWFGGMTRNPWNPTQGSSGSSAGPASAVAAGLVPFAVGSETWGSIVSPCTRCGVTGLRPTFGRVSRHGAMALSWTMDKLGPMARSAEDCRLAFRYLHGRDPLDPTTVDRPYDETRAQDGLRGLRIGFAREAFEADRTAGVDDEGDRRDLAEWADLDRAALRVLEGLGATLVPVTLPDRIDVPSLALILTAEATTAFDTLTRTGRDEELTRQVAAAWPNVFRQGQLIPAVEYLRANRIRTLLMRDWETLFDDVDVYVTPSFVGDGLLATNLTGHPQVVVPDGFTSSGAPVSLSFVGRLWGEGDVLAVAEAYQAATDFHRRRPDLDAVLAFREDA